MKKNLAKIFNKKNLKIIIPTIILIVLLIVIIIYINAYRYNRYRDKETYTVYQYFVKEKHEYDAIVSVDKHKVIKEFKPVNINVNYGTYPIYSTKDKKVIFPGKMSIIFPLKKKMQYKVLEFSYIEKINNLHYLTTEDYHKNVDHYIMYDGDDLYFFSDSVTFTINNKEITLSPMSYVNVTDRVFSYYDYETDTYETYDIDSNIILSNEYYKVDAKNDYVEYYDSKLLLTNDLDYLNVLKDEK